MAHPVKTDELTMIDMLLTEIEVTTTLLGTVRNEYLGCGERLTSQRASEANDNVFAVELALSHIHDHYANKLNAMYAERKERRNGNR